MKKGDIIKFGSYPQDANGVKFPIEWLVLDVKENEALLISRYGLDYKPYGNDPYSFWWERSELRRWLNDNFIKSAFSNEDVNKILISELKQKANPKFDDCCPGNDTKDRVFCLSIAEAEQYFSSDEDRKCERTEYAREQGDYVYARDIYCPWWLRTPGFMEGFAASVNPDGKLNFNGFVIHESCCAVRPALRILTF